MDIIARRAGSRQRPEEERLGREVYDDERPNAVLGAERPAKPKLNDSGALLHSATSHPSHFEFRIGITLVELLVVIGMLRQHQVLEMRDVVP